MTTPSPEPPTKDSPTTESPTTVLRDALLTNGTRRDVIVADGKITSIVDARTVVGDVMHDLNGLLLLPAFAEAHGHLDKALSADAVPNPAGDLSGAVTAWMDQRARRSVADFASRADAAVARQAAFGTTAIRTHVDLGAGVELKAVEALIDIRERWRDEVTIQIAALSMPLTGPDGDHTRGLLRDALSMGIDGIGGVPSFETDSSAAITVVLDLAAEFGRFVDLHVDESLDPAENTIVELARQVHERGTPHVTASHVVSLGVRPPDAQAVIASQIAQAAITVVTLPQTNLFLQARGIASSAPRGLTALDALETAGALVVAGGDNLEDPFNLMGRGDPLETASLLVAAGHRTPDVALTAVSTGARLMMGLGPNGAAGGEIAPGDVADLVALDAQSVRHAIATAPSERMTFRHGRLTFHTSHNVHRFGPLR